MTAIGTIDRPLTHDPLKQAPMTPHTTSEQPHGAAHADFITAGAIDLASEQDPRNATHPRSPGSCPYGRAHA